MFRLTVRTLASIVIGGYTLSAMAIAEETTSLQAVMYALTFDAHTLNIRHAQVIGGYPSLAGCREAMARVRSLAAAQLKSDERLQLQCSGVRAADEEPHADRNTSAIL